MPPGCEQFTEVRPVLSMVPILLISLVLTVVKRFLYSLSMGNVNF